MAELYHSISVTNIAATVSAVMGIDPPQEAQPANEIVVDYARIVFDGCHADRVFLYNPDALATWLFGKYTNLFAPVLKNTCLQIPTVTVMPSVTPVCFGSMYSGAYPEQHGIRRYEKPVLTIDTLFDAAIRAGKRVAIVSEEKASISMIFLNRAMDYYIYPTIDECNTKASELIDRDEYDLIVVYNGNYDARMHKCAPESEESLNELKRNAADFASFCDQIAEKWKRYNVMTAFLTDHGCHEIDGGCGSHGLDMPEDLNITHFFDFRPAQK